MRYLFLLLFPLFSEAQNINIPDPVLKSYFVGPYGYHIDFDNDGEVSQTEALTLTSFVAGYFYGIGGVSTISDFTGLEHFTNLQSIQIVFNYATSLNLTNLSNLKTLQINGSSSGPFQVYYSPVSTLNLTGCTALEYINIDYSSVQSLDLTTNVSLKEFYANSSKLENVNFSGLSLLEKVEINYGSLQNAIFSGNNSLKELRTIYQPNLQFLDLTEAHDLSLIEVQQSNLNTLKVDNLSNLEYLYCHNNQITELNLEGANRLKKIHCEYNKINKLNLSNSNDIEIIYCHDNLIEELKVSPECDKLQYVFCGFNKIKELDFEGLGNEFVGLSCENNLLNELHVKGTNLLGLNCSNNLLTELDLEWLQNFEGLDCSNNQIKFINLKHVINNPYDLLVSSNIRWKFENNPLQFLCVDEFQINNYKSYFSAVNINNVSINSDCVFEFVIYPNPVDDLLTIYDTEIVEFLKIYDVNGRVVFTTPVNSNSYSGSVEHLQTGIYLVEVKTNSSLKASKLIKN
ncbi:MAG: T9SS type A sorting domain-containing protein [Flavobacteriales bacterium]|nr:T9SS type A sorting domain-containing protein [Flavobacteriales bacterium]